jgi:hypothetical protein
MSQQQSSVSSDYQRKRERDQLFQTLYQRLPDEERMRLKEYAKRTLKDKPPTMSKIEAISIVSACHFLQHFIKLFRWYKL